MKPILRRNALKSRRKKIWSVAQGALACSLTWSQLGVADVPIDHVPRTLSLPDKYPDSWIFVYVAPEVVTPLGSYAIVDVAAETSEYKGQFQGAFFPSLLDLTDGSELYVAESFFERAGHGRRTDVLTVVDKSRLGYIAEVVLPGAKRGVVAGNIMDVTNDRRLLLILNFTPALSVTVVDLKARRTVSEIPIPGCTSIYPSGTRGFSSLCANGTLVSFVLGARGQVVHESRSSPFNDIDHDVLYLEATTARGVTYFASSRGNVRPIDMNGDVPTVQQGWPLLSAEQIADGWRTAAGRFLAADEQGHLYLRLYRETGYDAHIPGNTEVWVFDVSSHKRVRRIPLKNGASSIEVTGGQQPYLVVVAGGDPIAGEGLDVYDPKNGKLIRTIGGWRPGAYLSLVQPKR